LFGSAARGTDTPTSDVDLLADLDSSVSLITLAGLERELHELLGVPVDIVPAASLKPPMVQEVMAEAISL
jgi:predicted nucleotidyltransferase